MNINILESDLVNFLPFFIANSEGELVFCNDLFANSMEYEPKDLFGKKMNTFKSGMHTEEFYRELWQTLKSKKTWRGTFCNLSKNKKFVWLDTIIIPYENSTASGYYGFRVDKSREYKLEKNNLDLTNRINSNLDNISTQQEIYLLCQSFLHTLNNPLTVFDLNYHYIKNKLIKINEIDDKYKKQLTMIDDAIERLKKVGAAFSNIVSTSQSSRDVSFKFIMESMSVFLQDISNSRKIDFEWLKTAKDDEFYLSSDSQYLFLAFFDVLRNLDLKSRGKVTINSTSNHSCEIIFSSEDSININEAQKIWQQKKFFINEEIDKSFEIFEKSILLRICYGRK